VSLIYTKRCVLLTFLLFIVEILTKFEQMSKQASTPLRPSLGQSHLRPKTLTVHMLWMLALMVDGKYYLGQLL